MRSARIIIPALTLTLGACGISQEVFDQEVGKWKATTEQCETERDAALTEKAALEEARKKLSDDNAQLSSDKAQCLDELARVATEKGAVTSDLNSALAQLRLMRDLAAKQKATLDALMNGLQSMVTAGKVKIVRRNGRLVVEIAENILFDSGKSALKPDGKDALTQIAPVLAGVNREFQVSGHTDNVGGEAFNWKLSMDRALSVLSTMREAGYPGERISAAGYAWFQPVGTNDTKDGRQLNRRVDIVLVPNLDELKLLPAVTAAPACGEYLALAERVGDL